MEFVANVGKNVEIEVAGDIYLRRAIQTRFITANDNYIDILKELEDKILKKMIRDNPAGQGQQRTPLILIRKNNENMKKINKIFMSKCF